MLEAGPADVIFLDDRPDNVAAAAALGIRSIHFTGPEAARAALARYGMPVPKAPDWTDERGTSAEGKSPRQRGRAAELD